MDQTGVKLSEADRSAVEWSYVERSWDRGASGAELGMVEISDVGMRGVFVGGAMGGKA